jgi:hypothetical protein
MACTVRARRDGAQGGDASQALCMFFIHFSSFFLLTTLIVQYDMQREGDKCQQPCSFPPPLQQQEKQRRHGMTMTGRKNDREARQQQTTTTTTTVATTATTSARTTTTCNANTGRTTGFIFFLLYVLSSTIQ